MRRGGKVVPTALFADDDLTGAKPLQDDAAQPLLQQSRRRLLASNRLAPGQKLYRQGTSEAIVIVDKYLSQGNFGEVYSAHHVETQRRLALKRARFSILSDAKERHECEKGHLKESALMLSLARHRNVMALEYCAIDGSEFLMFLEFIDGASDLLAQIKSGKLYARAGNEARAYIFEVLLLAAAGIAFVNEHGVLHQDVKSENVMIGSHDGSVKLADFGLAAHGVGNGATLRAPYQGCTPGYDSPQVRVAKGKALLSVCEHDLWAFACMALDVHTASRSTITGLPMQKLEQLIPPLLPQPEWGWPQIEAWARAMHPCIVTALEECGVTDGRALLAIQPSMDGAKRLGIKIAGAKKKLQFALLAPEPTLRSVLVRCFDPDPAKRPQSLAEVVLTLAPEEAQARLDSHVKDKSSSRERAVALRNLGSSMVEKSFDESFGDDCKSFRDDAIKAFDDAAQFIPEDPLACAEALSMKGGTLMLSNDYTGAASACQAVIGLNPTHGRAIFNLGAALEAQGCGDAATAKFEAAAAVTERASTGAYVNMAAGAAMDEAAEAQRHRRWFVSENGTLHDAVSGRPYSIDEICVKLTLSESKEDASKTDTASSSSSNSNDAWDDAAEWEAGLIPPGVSLRCVPHAREWFRSSHNFYPMIFK